MHVSQNLALHHHIIFRLGLLRERDRIANCQNLLHMNMTFSYIPPVRPKPA